MPLLMGVEEKCLSWDSGWKEGLLGVSVAFCSQLAAIILYIKPWLLSPSVECLCSVLPLTGCLNVHLPFPPLQNDVL